MTTTKCICEHTEDDHASGALIGPQGIVQQPCLECFECPGFIAAESVDPLRVSCPVAWCKAARGKKCKFLSGDHRAGVHHHARFRIATETQR